MGGERGASQAQGCEGKGSKLKIYKVGLAGGGEGRDELGGGAQPISNEERFSVDLFLCTRAFLSLLLPFSFPFSGFASLLEGAHPDAAVAQAVRMWWEDPWVPILDC